MTQSSMLLYVNETAGSIRTSTSTFTQSLNSDSELNVVLRPQRTLAQSDDVGLNVLRCWADLLGQTTQIEPPSVLREAFQSDTLPTEPFPPLSVSFRCCDVSSPV